MKVIEFKNVWENYRTKFVLNRRRLWKEIWVLENINFSVKKGECLGIIGENGAGKTTLLKLIAGMLKPDKGEIKTEGKILTLMEIGAGFHPDLTGRENIYFNASLYGIDRRQINPKMNGIINFADIGKFIDVPIRHYSQGMYLRLAFGLAVHVEPDILLIDDILTIGDENAQRKCFDKIMELRNSGKTIILVSHNMNMIHKLCDRVIFLAKGRMVQKDIPSKVVPRYLETVGENKGIGKLERGNLRIVFNNGKIFISWKGTALTKHFGGYSSFYYSPTDTWCFSVNADWEAKKISANEIFAEGIYHHLPIKEIWRIKQTFESQFDWQVNIECEDLSIKGRQAGFFLVPQYKDWFSLDEKQQFPHFSFKQDWQEINPDKHKEIFLALGTSSSEKEIFPFFALETKKDNYPLKILNTGYNTESRIIQSRFFDKEPFSGTIKIFPEKENFKNYIQELRAEYYSSRTICHEHLKIYADVNSKSLRIYYKERELTKVDGFHSFFLVNEKWFDTNSCNCKVEKKNEELFVTFLWEEISFTQRWKFAFNREGQLLWDIDLKSEKAIKFDLLKVRLTLLPDYKRWFCSSQEGDFPQEFSFGQDMPLKDKRIGFLGLKKEGELPAVILECQDSRDNFFSVIQNSNSQLRSRVLELCLNNKEFCKEGSESLSGKVSFLDEESFIEKERQKQEEKLMASRSISKGDLKVYADVANKGLSIFCKNEVIGEGCSLFTLIETKEFGYSRSDDFSWEWEVIKESNEKMDVSLYHQALGLRQRWTLSCQERNILKINVEIDLQKSPLYLINQGILLSVRDTYKQWRTPYEKGTFSTWRYIGDTWPVRLKYNRVSKIFLEDEDNKYLPKLTFDCSLLGDERILGVEKRNNKSIMLFSYKLVSFKNKKVPVGKYRFFSGKIILNADVSWQEMDKGSLYQINKGNLKVVFADGRGRIFWQDKELTFGLGMYTSVRSSGIWYDSTQAIWQRERIEKNRMVFRGDWAFIPISQVWKLKFISKNLISWEVEMGIYNEANLEIEQANLMLSSQYKNWIIPNIREGGFLDEFTEDYDILPFRFWYGKVNNQGLKVINKGLPYIVFKVSNAHDSYRAIIENTDCLYKARLIQYQKSKLVKKAVHTRKYFEGIIKIESKI